MPCMIKGRKVLDTISRQKSKHKTCFSKAFIIDSLPLADTSLERWAPSSTQWRFFSCVVWAAAGSPVRSSRRSAAFSPISESPSRRWSEHGRLCQEPGQVDSGYPHLPQPSKGPCCRRDPPPSLLNIGHFLRIVFLANLVMVVVSNPFSSLESHESKVSCNRVNGHLNWCVFTCS